MAKMTSSLAQTYRPTLVVDNGASSIKIGTAVYLPPQVDRQATSDQFCRVMPNCIAKSRSERRRPFIASQVEDCRDTSGLFFLLPFQKGYMSAPDIQKSIWDYVFSPECLAVTPSECNILITEPILNFVSNQDIMCELIYEEYGFFAACRTTAAHMADFKYARDHASDAVCTLVVDSGYSFTHIIPFVNGAKVPEAVRRIDIGGKALTNHLKEVLSYRQLHVLDETYLINQVKEDLCYVSTNLMIDMQIARRRLPDNYILREYVLPDYTNIRKGFVRPTSETGTKSDNEQLLRMNNERFTIPELLFHPTDVGIDQMGISEAIMEVTQGFPESSQAHFFKNIILIGGNAKLPGFRERIQSDIRRAANVVYDVKVYCDFNPQTYAWRGGNKFAFDSDFPRYLVTKAKYEEYGLSIFRTKSDI